MGVVSEFIRQLQSYEEYTFSTDELLEATKAPEPTVKRELSKLVLSSQLVNIRKGFYIVLPPRYQSFGKLPIELYVDKLFRGLGKPYYVGFYSAAAFHGASHQKIQQDYVITAPPALRDIAKVNTKIRFFNITNWPKNNIQQRKSDAGHFNLSSPALTFVDLLENQRNLGGLNRMLPVLKELSEVVETSDLKALLDWYSNKSVLQRMGYLLGELSSAPKLEDLLFGHISKDQYYPVLLTPNKNLKAGSTGNRWRVDVNIQLESDI